ncbi:MAG: hypothetical protein LBR62_02535, partial [Puniceicoccales bacterium]|nr:hypothetical protein [Puniceicoccales bacterium]
NGFKIRWRAKILLYSLEKVKGIRARLLAWYKTHARVFPWRRNPSLYKTVVSEFMLQQTGTATVLPFFEKWIKVLPHFEALAKASEESVLLLWSGLGYYSRARYLRRLAVDVLASRPKTYKEWLNLKGIGPYTAAAVASIAFGEAVAAVDGNVLRILSRISGEKRLFAHKEQALKYFHPRAQAWLDPAHPGDYNQALMDLGAMLCTPRCPKCSGCPLKDFCLAHRWGTVDVCPRRTPSLRQECTKIRVWVCRDGRILLGRISGASLRDFYELPEWGGRLASWMVRRELYFVRKRSIGRRIFTEKIYRAKLRTPSLPGKDFRWVSWENLSEIPISGPHRKWIQEYGNLGFGAREGI